MCVSPPRSRRCRWSSRWWRQTGSAGCWTRRARVRGCWAAASSRIRPSGLWLTWTASPSSLFSPPWTFPQWTFSAWMSRELNWASFKQYHGIRSELFYFHNKTHPNCKGWHPGVVSWIFSHWQEETVGCDGQGWVRQPIQPSRGFCLCQEETLRNCTKNTSLCLSNLKRPTWAFCFDVCLNVLSLSGQAEWKFMSSMLQ